MFEAVKFPARVPNLNTGLSNVNADDLPHFLLIFLPRSIFLSVILSDLSSFFNVIDSEKKGERDLQKLDGAKFPLTLELYYLIYIYIYISRIIYIYHAKGWLIFNVYQLNCIKF